MPSSLENLTTACSTGDSSTLGNLLSTLTPSESQIPTLYETCASNSQLSALELLLTKYPTCAPHEDTIRAAIYTGSPPLFRVLVARDPLVVNTPLDKRGTSLSLTLSARLPIDFVRFLLDLGADSNADTAPPPSALATTAALYNTPDAIASSLAYGAEIKDSGAIEAAPHSGQKENLRFLLSRKETKE